ncbi:hypothetical protein BDW22DRAFT_460942 [Trametopsis cervina]|nr:hypothetical protein BDW22DRAFT_460942 [Trametopsis cervina]
MKDTASTISLRELRLDEVPQAVQLAEAAFENDPLQGYFRYTPNPADDGAWRENWHNWLGRNLTENISRGRAWTTEDVGAVLIYAPVSSHEEEKNEANARKKTKLSEEQLKRAGEWGEKSEKVIGDVLGDSRKETVYLDFLATSPEKQGRGYASALIRKVTGEADSQHRATWLMSSNVANVGFYHSFGFVTKASIVVGDTNPTWQNPPLIVELLVREAIATTQGSV